MGHGTQVTMQCGRPVVVYRDALVVNQVLGWEGGTLQGRGGGEVTVFVASPCWCKERRL